MSDPSTPTRPRPPLTVEEVAKIRDDYASPRADPQVEELCDAYEALRQSLVALRTELRDTNDTAERFRKKFHDAEAQRTEAEQARDAAQRTLHQIEALRPLIKELAWATTGGKATRDLLDALLARLTPQGTPQE